MSLRVRAAGAGGDLPDVAASAPAGPRRIAVGTDQQEALWRELAEGAGHVLVEARAGCGKSSSSREGMWRMLERRPGLRIRYTVFSKANADEFRGDCPPGVDVGTMHSFGFAACRAAFRCQLDKLKTWLCLEDMQGGRYLQRYLRTSIARLVSVAKNQMLVPPLSDDDSADQDAFAASLEPLLPHYDIRAYGQAYRICDWAARVLTRSATWTEVIDFDDMIWLPAVYNLEFPRADCTFIDECQDLNATQHRLVGQLAGGGRVVAVGDRFQSIYAFRGADSDSIPHLERQLGAEPRGLARLPLTITFRCPHSHVALAQQLVPDLQAHATNKDGVIEYDRPVDDLLERALPGDRVICPRNAPVVAAALKLIAAKRRAFVRGRAVGQELLGIVQGCGACKTVTELAKLVQAWRARELAHLEGLDGMEDVAEAVQDRAAGLGAILSACASPTEVEPLIRELFTESDQADAVQFSTVHRAKGAEAERVWFLDTAMRAPKQPWEAQQQANLCYVGLTRSRDVLTFVVPE